MTCSVVTWKPKLGVFRGCSLKAAGLCLDKSKILYPQALHMEDPFSCLMSKVDCFHLETWWSFCVLFNPVLFMFAKYSEPFVLYCVRSWFLKWESVFILWVFCLHECLSHQKIEMVVSLYMGARNPTLIFWTVTLFCNVSVHTVNIIYYSII